MQSLVWRMWLLYLNSDIYFNLAELNTICTQRIKTKQARVGGCGFCKLFREKMVPCGCGAPSISGVIIPTGYLGARKNKFNSWLSAELQILLSAKAVMLFMFKACLLAALKNRRLGCCYLTRIRKVQITWKLECCSLPNKICCFLKTLILK